jgi:hypothetical protein
MIPEVFISYTLSQLDRVIDYISENSKRDEFVKSTMKEALLGCCVDWRTRSKSSDIPESNEKLKRYAEMLNTATVKFRSSDMLSLPLCEHIWKCTREMVAISEVPITRGRGAEYKKATDAVIAELNSMYENFDSLYEKSKKEL